MKYTGSQQKKSSALESMRNNMLSIDAAALQSEMAKKYALPGFSSAVIRKKSTTVKNQRVRSSIEQNKPTSDSRIINQQQGVISYEDYSFDDAEIAQPTFLPMNEAILEDDGFLCESCGEESRSRDCCDRCGFFRLNNIRRGISLAEHRSLVAAPAKEVPILKGEWDRIESKLDSRLDAHCPICMVGFNQGSEVLLSCSHVFHKVCLQSFENFMKTPVRCCPICRTSNYQKRVTKQGTKAFEIVCARRIQCWWRGSIVRKKFYKNLKTYYKAGGGLGGISRKKFYERELTNVTSMMSKEVESRDRMIDDVLKSSDKAIEQSMEIDQLFDSLLLQRAAARETMERMFGNFEDSIPSSSDGIHDNFAQYSDAQAPKRDQEKKLNDAKWKEIIRQARARGMGDCAICMTSNSNGYHSSSKQMTILSCSHVFHCSCMSNFETFCKSMSKETCPLCPVCRSTYDRIDLGPSFQG